MFLRTAKSKWMVRAPAKLNVYLSVRGRRPDGYHEIHTLMAPIMLFDRVVVEPCPPGQAPRSGIELHLVNTGPPGRPLGQFAVPSDESNLAVRAAVALRERTGCQAGARISLRKQIPTGAGLGGGSSDAAAVLVAANAAWRLGLGLSELTEVAASIGSDVPFFLAGRPAVCTGRGEVVRPLSGAGRLHVIVATPIQRLASAAVYAQVRQEDFDHAQRASIHRSEQFLHAFLRGDVGTLGRLLYNGLERAALSLEPALGRLRDALGRLSGGNAAMTGSGSTFFCLCRTARQARTGAAYLRSLGYSSAMATTSYASPIAPAAAGMAPSLG